MAEQTDRREPVSRARIFPGATRLPMIASHNRKDARIKSIRHVVIALPVLPTL